MAAIYLQLSDGKCRIMQDWTAQVSYALSMVSVLPWPLI